MYSLDCSYYSKTFDSVDALVNDVIQSGMDPNYEITFNFVSINELINSILIFVSMN